MLSRIAMSVIVVNSQNLPSSYCRPWQDCLFWFVYVWFPVRCCTISQSVLIIFFAWMSVSYC